MNTYTEKEKILATKEARKQQIKNDAILGGLGATGYGVSRISQGFVDEKNKELYKKMYELGVNKAKTNTPEEELAISKSIEKIIPAAKKLGSLRMPLSVAKSVGALAAITGATKIAGGLGTRFIDPDKQGLLDDKYIRGDRATSLMAGGLGLMAAGGLGNFLITRKTGKALFNKSNLKNIDEGLDNLRSANFTNKKEYLKFKEGIHGNINTTKKHLKENNVKSSDLKALGFTGGLAGIGGIGFSDGLTTKIGGGKYNEILEKNRDMKKSGSFGMAAGLHGIQNAIGAGATKTKFGKKLLSEYLGNALAEGYHGRSFDGKALGAVSGVTNQLMPELKGLRREVRNMGKKLSDQGVDIYNLKPKDKILFSNIAQGNFVKASKNISDSESGKKIIKALFPKADDRHIIAALTEGESYIDTKSMKKMEDIYKKTTAHSILSAVDNHLRSNKLGVPKGATLKEYSKYNDAFDNAAHAGLAVLDPITAGFNALKRVAVSEKLAAKETSPNAIKKAVKYGNYFKKGVDVFFDTLPSMKARATGAIGLKDISPASRKFNYMVVNPMVENSRRDNYHFGQMAGVISESKNLPTEFSKAVNENKEKSRKFLSKYYDGTTKGAYARAKLLLGMAKKNETSPKDISNILGALSDDQSKVERAAQTIKNEGQKAYDKNIESINDLKDSVAQTVTNRQRLAENEVEKIDLRIKKWQLPGMITGGGLLVSPMAKGIYDRNKEERNKMAKNKPSYRRIKKSS